VDQLVQDSETIFRKLLTLATSSTTASVSVRSSSLSNTFSAQSRITAVGSGNLNAEHDVDSTNDVRLYRCRPQDTIHSRDHPSLPRYKHRHLEFVCRL